MIRGAGPVDGGTWVSAITFADAAIPTFIGPFASNYNPTPAKALPTTMSVNWFLVQ
jgi:hypothetical protein